MLPEAFRILASSSGETKSVIILARKSVFISRSFSFFLFHKITFLNVVPKPFCQISIAASGGWFAVPVAHIL